MTNAQMEAVKGGCYDSSEQSCLGECVKCSGWKIREYKTTEEDNFQLCDRCLIEILGDM